MIRSVTAQANLEEAKAQGLSTFVGDACVYGHCERYTRKPACCVTCKHLSDKKYNSSPNGQQIIKALEQNRPSRGARYSTEARRTYKRNLRAMNLNYRIADVLRSRTNLALRGKNKGGSARRDLGCTIEYFKAFIAMQFKPGMSWNNWAVDTWHLDHKIPLSSFDLSDREQFLKAAHYTNYQPLWAAENLSKGARL